LGHLDTVTALLGIDALLVSPTSWMSYFELKREKEESRSEYKKRLLQFARSRCRDKSKREQLNLKTCDAYLIALYGYNQIIKKKDK